MPRARRLALTRAPLVMGVLNVTPDSFSDGGVHFDQSKAVHAAIQMEEDGAAIVDIGGESTRPGAEPVSADEEISRVVPVIEQVRRRCDVPISIDTTKGVVAEAALNAGADIINDVSALNRDPKMRSVAARACVPVILMHMRGEPRTMQQLAKYDDVVSDVARELSDFVESAVSAGIDKQQILVDPGIGFAKNAEHNLELLARCDELRVIAPVVIGASRKAFIGHLTGRAAGEERMVGSLAAVAAAFRGGAAVVRVHDVRDTIDFLRVMTAIEEKERR
ncbi:MAG TPA: dihydropteroate synthase [Thermoanaerobaculia bacterium]|nr:dihydropteroate synthase [Thermoanaerobaculia bacterium]